MSGDNTSLFDVRKKLLEEVDELKRKKAQKKEPTKQTRDISVVMVAKRSLPQELVAEIEVKDLSAQAFQLTHVYLDRMRLGAIDNLECFNQITHLHLQRNEIERIEGLDYAPNLQVLRLDYNRISVVENLGHLKSLKVLDLGHNRIQGLELDEKCPIPSSVEDLRLNDNPYTGYKAQIPAACLPNLKALDGKSLDAADDAKETSQTEEVDEDVDEDVWNELKKAQDAQVAAYLSRRKDKRGGAGAPSTEELASVGREKLMDMWGADAAGKFEAALNETLDQFKKRSVRGEIIKRAKERQRELVKKSERTIRQTARAVEFERKAGQSKSKS